MPPSWEPIKEVGLEIAEPHIPGELPEDLLAIKNEFTRLADEAQRVKLVYAATGQALYAAQCFETEIQLAILLVGKAKGTLASEQAYTEACAQLSTKTLGRLLKEVQQVVKFGDNGRALLELAHERRNSLAHGFFEHYSLEFPIKSGKQIMLVDLLKRTALFREADRSAQIVRKKMMVHIGFTDENVAQALAHNQAEMEAKEKARSKAEGT